VSAQMGAFGIVAYSETLRHDEAPYSSLQINSELGIGRLGIRKKHAHSQLRTTAPRTKNNPKKSPLVFQNSLFIIKLAIHILKKTN